MPSMGGWEWLILLVVLVLLFGAKRLPDMARSLGQSARVLKGEMKGMKDDDPARNQAKEPRRAEPPALPAAEERPAQPPAASSEQPGGQINGTR